jgi:hypothetical protein
MLINVRVGLGWALSPSKTDGNDISDRNMQMSTVRFNSAGEEVQADDTRELSMGKVTGMLGSTDEVCFDVNKNMS